MNLSVFSIIFSVACSLLTALGVVVAIRMSARQIKQEESYKATEAALLTDHVKRLKESVDHAHEKIRDLYSKSNDVNVVIAELRTTMQENNRVLRQVEQALSVLSKIEERINGHIDAEKRE